MQKLKKYKWLFLAALGLLLILIFFAWTLFQGPSKGVIKTIKTTEKSNLAAETILKELKGKTFSLSYPSNFTPQDLSSNPNYTGLDNFVLSTNNFAGNDHLAVAVTLAQGPLISDSAYHYRLLYHDIYTQDSQTLNGDEVHTFVKTTNGYEQTIFILHKDKVATLALTSSSNDQEKNGKIMRQVYQSYKWLSP